MEAEPASGQSVQRYYDPLCGCFLSVDPITALDGPFNRYWYANNSPYRYTDSDGMLASDEEEKTPPPPPPIEDIPAIIVVAQRPEPGMLFPTRYEAETAAMYWSKVQSRGFWSSAPSYIILQGKESGDFTFYPLNTGVAPTAGGLRVLGGLRSIAEKTVAAAIRSRGGGGSQIQQVASNLRDVPLGQVANMAAEGNREAIKAVKMVKQAATKAERY